MQQIIGPLGLEILPASESTLFASSKKTMKLEKNWSEYATNMFMQSISEAKTMEFVPSTTLERHGKIAFGDIIMTTFSGRQYSITEKLICNNCAKWEKNIDQFKKDFDKTIITHVERWNDSNRFGGVLKNEESTIVVDYNVEIASRKYHASILDPNQSKDVKDSIKKVQEWRKKIEGFENCLPDIDSISDIDLNKPMSTLEIRKKIARLDSIVFSDVTVKQDNNNPVSIMPAGCLYKTIVKKRKYKKIEVVDDDLADFNEPSASQVNVGVDENKSW